MAVSENKKFPHGQLDDFLDLDDLTLESFEEAQAEYVNYPEDIESELDDLVDLEDDIEVVDDLEDSQTLDDIEISNDLEPLAIADLEDFDEFEELDLKELDDELEDLKDIEELDEQDRQRVSEARHALQGISKMLDSLINEEVDDDSPEEVRERCFRPIDTRQVFETLEKKQHRDHESRRHSRDVEKKRHHRDYEDKREVIDAEFRDIEEQTDNLDRILSRSKEKSVSDQYVSDLYEHRDWDLVIDEELLEKTEAVINSINNNHDTFKAQGVEKKSLSTLATALLAGGGVLVFGLATAGVVTAVKSLRKKPKYHSSYLSEPVEVKPVSFAKPPPEPEPEPEPEPIKQKIIEPDRVEPMYREMPPQQHRYPPRPFWGIVPPPPPYDDKDVAL
jgi:hypothetical protein